MEARYPPLRRPRPSLYAQVPLARCCFLDIGVHMACSSAYYMVLGLQLKLDDSVTGAGYNHSTTVTLRLVYTEGGTLV